jgi:hypothetical protein
LRGRACKIVAFAAWVRARQRRATVLGVLGLILLAQTALVAHQIQHDAVAHTTTCVLCLAAGHLTGDAPAVQSPISVFALVERVSVAVAQPALSRPPLPYLSRGPPSFQP